MDIQVNDGDIINRTRDSGWRRYAGAPKPRFGIGSIFRHKRLLAPSCTVCLLVALAYGAIRPATYTAAAQLLVYNRQIATGQDPVILPGSVDIPLVNNQIEIIRSRAVLAKVIGALNLVNDREFFSRPTGILHFVKSLIASPPILADENSLSFGMTLDSLRRQLTVRRVGTSHIVLISFRASEPEKAARVTNQIARAYLAERARLLSETSTIRELYQGLGPSAYVISEAEPPIRSDGLPMAAILVAAAVIGLGVGMMIAVVLDVVDNTLRDPEQIEYYLGLDCLGMIPALGNRGFERNAPRYSGNSSVLCDELQRVKAALEDLRFHDFRAVGVTSATPGEGATTIAAGLACMMRDSGKKVLLISKVSHARLPSRRLFRDLKQRPIDATEAPASASAEAVMGSLDGSNVLPSSAVLDLDHCCACRTLLDDMLCTALELYDYVIVDMPSLVSGAAVRAAADLLDGFLLVVRSGVTDGDLLRQAVHSAGEARPKFIGAVLNMAAPQTLQRYGDKRPRAGREAAPPPHGKEASFTSETTGIDGAMLAGGQTALLQSRASADEFPRAAY